MSSLLHMEVNVQESDLRSVLIPVQKVIHLQVLGVERRNPSSQCNSSESLSSELQQYIVILDDFNMLFAA